jgi:hypothetical protein
MASSKTFTGVIMNLIMLGVIMNFHALNRVDFGIIPDGLID